MNAHWEARSPPTECDFEGPHSKISAMRPDILQSLFQAYPQLTSLYLPHTPLSLLQPD